MAGSVSEGTVSLHVNLQLTAPWVKMCLWTKGSSIPRMITDEYHSVNGDAKHVLRAPAVSAAY